MGAGRLVKNALSGGGLWATEALIGFVMTPVLLAALGKQGFGIWALMGVFVGYMGLLDLGLSPAIMRNVAFADGQGESEKAQRIFGTAMVTLGLMGLLAAAALLVMSNWAEVLLNARDSDTNLRVLFYLFAALVAVSFVRAALVAALLGLQSHSVVNGIRIAINVIRASIVYVGLTSGVSEPLLYLASLHLVATIVECCLMAVLASRQKVASLHAVTLADWPTAKELLGFGAKSMFGMGAVRLIRQGVLIVISQVAGTAQIVFYSIPNKLVTYGDSLLAAVSFPLTAYLANVVGRGGVGAVAAKWVFSTRMLQCLAFCITTGIAFLGLPFLARWVGADVAAQSRDVFFVILGVALVRVFNMNTNRLLQSLNRHGSSAAFAGIMGGIALLLAIPLCYAFGVAGAALALLIFQTGHALFEIRLVSQHLGISWIGHVLGAARRFAPPVAAASLVYVGLRVVLPPASYPAMALHAALASIVFLAVAWFVSFDEMERAFFRAGIAARFRRARKA